MKVLIVPMLAIAQTEGPTSRAKSLAKAFVKEGIQVALCSGDDKSISSLAEVAVYPIAKPVPLGLPPWIGLRTYPLADRLGIIGKKTVHSFEEVLYLTGAGNYHYLASSIAQLRKVIQSFQPDVLYSEFNLSAMIAAKAEGLAVVASYSYPTQPDFAASPKFAGGVNRILQELGQAPVKSSLELFQRADFKVVPSSFALEPICDENCRFVGPFGALPERADPFHRDCFLVYLGTGTLVERKIKKVISEVFRELPYEVYVAGMSKEQDFGRLHFGRWFDFRQLLPRAAAFLHHGGQNSMMDSFLYGVPQMIYPGKVFERNYNAQSVQKSGAGILLGSSEFQAECIKNAFDRLLESSDFRENALRTGEELRTMGDATRVASLLRSMHDESYRGST